MPATDGHDAEDTEWTTNVPQAFLWHLVNESQDMIACLLGQPEVLEVWPLYYVAS